MKELVILDIDNTILKGFSQGLFVDYLYKKGQISFFQKILIVFWFVLYKIGFIKNPKPAMEYGLSFIKNKTLGEVDETVDDFFNTVWIKKIYPEMEKIIKDHQNKGRTLILVSNAPDVLVEKLANYLKISEWVSTELEVKNGIYTGKIIDEIMYGEQKIKGLNKYINDRGLSLENSWGYGDHDTDMFLLSEVSHPVAVNPSGGLRSFAIKNNWQILKTKI
ncbi:MAG: putative phosphoserine phosphatase / 1-acylglycerol-3-phosphate O-acyltransferase [Parcubacteria bacterium C7867-006]|nr:MAG: putative phosphoserine phosphatase / 1-acylglycerol-3-phosphate O-acyltransferase [Parcubacteria bacterium C7867-006]